MTLRQEVFRGLCFSAALAAVVAGCLSLDPFLFKGEQIDAYGLDSYDGRRECGDAIDSLGPLTTSIVREVSFASGNETVYGIFLHDTMAHVLTDTVVLYFHGNTDHIDYYWPRARLLHATGYPVLVVDYRGYGKSTGQPTEEGLYQDGLAALRYLETNLGDPAVLVYAFSLGSLVGCQLVLQDSRHRIYALALEAPIGSVQTMAADASYLDLPGTYVSTYKGNNAARIKSVDIPLLWLHGTDDETLALASNGQPIWDNYAGPAGYCVKVEGGGHGTTPGVMGYNRYVELVGGYVRANVPSWVSCRK